MKIQKQSFEIVHPLPLDRKRVNEMLHTIEKAGRTCYKSEDKMTDESAEAFVKMLINRGHESVLEHQSIGVRFICDRGVSHEFVRHRLSSFSQESTRYCNYSKDKFGNQINVIAPLWCKNIQEGEINGRGEIEAMPNLDEDERRWLSAMAYAEHSYNLLIEQGWIAQQARSVLPNSLKTEIVITANLRQWREMFRQRCSKAAHPQMRELMVPLLCYLQETIPVIFDDMPSECYNI